MPPFPHLFSGAGDGTKLTGRVIVGFHWDSTCKVVSTSPGTCYAPLNGYITIIMTPEFLHIGTKETSADRLQQAHGYPKLHVYFIFKTHFFWEAGVP